MTSPELESARRAVRGHAEQIGRLIKDAAEINIKIHYAAESLLSRQTPQGFWCGELTADTTLESDYILLQLWLHQPEGSAWNPPSRARIEKACRSILERQLPSGGFNIYHCGPAEVSGTVEAYCALKLTNS